MDYILDVPLEILEDIDVDVISSNNEDLGY
ncbi:hypothetical protein SAMN04488156_1407 [Bacillus sp. 166amftsu]|nr:hypothetical protein SAMN04488156_1407 [Bacillus sp. 166amftsu]